MPLPQPELSATAEPEREPRSLRAASWPQIQALFELEPGAIHLNSGTVGALPAAVIEVHDETLRRWTGGLMDVYGPTMFSEQRAAIGRAYGVDGDEIVITHNATEGIARVINGLDLHAGDEVVTTSQECYSVLSNFNLVRNRHGISLRVLTLPTGYDVGVDEIVALFEAAITARTRVLAFSAITLWTGMLMPVRELCDLAERHGLVTVVDGALLTGMLDRSLRALGPDFVACSGSKYQCGPLGTGILYIRNKVFPEYNALPLPTLWPVISTWYPMVGDTPPRTSTRVASYNVGDYLQMAGSASIARAAALTKACEMWDEIGRARIERRVFELGEHARERILARFGEQAMYSPGADERLRSPLVAFNPFRRPQDAWNVKHVHELTERLASEHKIWIRWTEFEVPHSPHQHYAARVAPHIFNDHAQIDEALAVLDRLAQEIA